MSDQDDIEKKIKEDINELIEKNEHSRDLFKYSKIHDNDISEKIEKLAQKIISSKKEMELMVFLEEKIKEKEKSTTACFVYYYLKANLYYYKDSLERDNSKIKIFFEESFRKFPEEFLFLYKYGLFLQHWEKYEDSLMYIKESIKVFNNSALPWGFLYIRYEILPEVMKKMAESFKLYLLDCKIECIFEKVDDYRLFFEKNNLKYFWDVYFVDVSFTVDLLKKTDQKIEKTSQKWLGKMIGIVAFFAGCLSFVNFGVNSLGKDSLKNTLFLMMGIALLLILLGITSSYFFDSENWSFKNARTWFLLLSLVGLIGLTFYVGIKDEENKLKDQPTINQSNQNLERLPQTPWFKR